MRGLDDDERAQLGYALISNAHAGCGEMFAMFGGTDDDPHQAAVCERPVERGLMVSHRFSPCPVDGTVCEIWETTPMGELALRVCSADIDARRLVGA